MKILFNLSHPGHVHLFKNAIIKLHNEGHRIFLTIIDKDVTVKLIEIMKLPFWKVGDSQRGLFSKAMETFKIEKNILKLAIRYKPDVLVGGVGNLYVTHVAQLINKPSIIFDDTEHAKIEHILMDPFATKIYTPNCYKKNLGRKQERYNGYHEVAYLHPRYFNPDQGVLKRWGISKKEKICIVRFVAWDAGHDRGYNGISNKVSFIQELSKYSRVIITSENHRLPELLRPYHINIAPEELHHLLYFSSLYIGEGATTASESAVLGTHAIYINPLSVSYVEEQSELYDLVYSYNDINQEGNALDKAILLLSRDELWKEGKRKREKLLKDKIDVTAFIVKKIKSFS